MVKKHYFHITHIHKPAVGSSSPLGDALDHMHAVCLSVPLVFYMVLFLIYWDEVSACQHTERVTLPEPLG